MQKRPVKKDAARQIGGYGNKSYTLKGEPGTVGHLPTYRREVIPYQVMDWGRAGRCPEYTPSDHRADS